jgi:hypothetical protein
LRRLPQGECGIDLEFQTHCQPSTDAGHARPEKYHGNMSAYSQAAKAHALALAATLKTADQWTFQPIRLRHPLAHQAA